MTFQHVSLSVKSRSASFSEDDMHVALQAQHFRRVVLRAFAGHIVSAASSGDSVQTLWQTWAIVRGLVCAAGAAFGEVPLRVECPFV